MKLSHHRLAFSEKVIIVLLVLVSAGENFELIFNAAPSCDDISYVIRLCSDHSLLGTRLLENATTLLNVRASSVPPQAGNFLIFLYVRFCEERGGMEKEHDLYTRENDEKNERFLCLLTVLFHSQVFGDDKL